MVARGGARQSSWNAGEMHPELAGRVDIKQYYSAGLAYQNIEPVPQSGFRQMAGTRDNGPVRGRVSGLSLSNAQSFNGPHDVGTHTIWSADVSGQLTAASFVISLTSGPHLVICEALVAGNWQQLGPSFSIGSSTAFTFARPPGQPISATGLRLRATVGADGVTSSVNSAVALQESTSAIDVPRYSSLRHDSGDRYHLSLQRQFLDIYRDDDWLAGVYVPAVTASIQPEIGFYAENATIGLFHREMLSQRVIRAGFPDRWTRGTWPYEEIPTVDLGGDYPKTSAEFEIWVRWTQASNPLSMSFSVDGESTPSIALGTTTIGDATTDDWGDFRGAIEAAIRDLDGMNDGVVVSFPTIQDTFSRKFTVTFGGTLSGVDYEFFAQVNNTAEVSALTVPTQKGETEFEPLLSNTRGWPGGAALAQDRLAYFDINAERAALALSQAGEYFKLNIRGSAASAARLDRLRAGQTAERILAVREATFVLIFTDQNVYFASNRTISSQEPLNFTITSETGIVPYTLPLDLEGKIYFVGQNPDDAAAAGSMVLSLSYDELGSRFDAVPESLLASHLVRTILRTARQRSSADTDAARLWMMRDDGVLIAAQVIASQEILGFCRWHAAAGGVVREMTCDASNTMRLAVARGGQLRHERMDRSLVLHACLARTVNLAGVVTGLQLHEGRQVWAQIGDAVLGPYTVEGGQITLDQHYAGTIQVGLWQPPRWESMPRWLIRRDDTIVKRPGRIHTAIVEVIDTTSIAIGANGQPALDVTLARIGDPAEAPTPPATRKLTRSGMLGNKDGTTLVITQTRPGRLRVRDVVIEEKL
jgi:hypothetical protein